MANIKFSQFTVGSDYTAITDLVGYSGANNIRITPDNLISSWNAEQQTIRFSNLLSGGAASTFGIGAVSNSSTTLTLDTGGTASYKVNGLDAISYDGTDWNLANGFITTSGSDVTIASRVLTIGDGVSDIQVDLLSGVAVRTAEIRGGGSQILLQSPGSDLLIGPNDDIYIEDTGSPLIVMQSPTRFSTDVEDISGSAGSANFILKSNGGSGNGVSWRQEQPGCQIKIAGAAGLTNTNNGTDFLVPYNTVIVNDDATIFNPVVTGGFGNQGAIQVLQDGRYEFFARYSSFDLVQPSLPTVDGNKFFRITAATDVAAPGVGTKQCILQDLIVATSVNGEANVTGGGFMDLSAGDYFKIIGFHNGATGGTGTQGFPVNSNAFFNEPMLWLVKIQ